MKQKNGYLYIYSSGRVAKINKQNGEVIWQTKLKDVGISGATVANMQVDGEKIFIGSSGVLVCINESDGEVVWSNSLKGWGYGYVIFANQNQAEAIHHKVSQSPVGSSSTTS